MDNFNTYFYPSNFDLESFCLRFNFRKIDVAKLLDKYTIQHYKKDEFYRVQYHTAQYLKNYVGKHYKTIRDTLATERVGVLEQVSEPIIGKIAAGYQLRDDYYYNLELELIQFEKEITGDNLNQKRFIDNDELHKSEMLNKVPIIKQKANLPNRLLTDWYSPLIDSLLNNKIEIDMEDFKEVMYQGKYDLNPDKYRSYLAAATLLTLKPIPCKADINHRFYTPLSSLPKVLRQTIRVNGERLAGIDISNAQPYLLSIIADKYMLNELVKKHLIEVKKQKLDEFIKLLETKPKDLSKYTEVVKRGEFYESLIGVNGIESRKEVKDYIVKLINDSGFSWDSERQKVRIALNRIYPTINKLLQLLKSVDYKYVSYSLMRIESHEFAIKFPQEFFYLKEHQHIPLFTIHDCFLTTESNIDYLETWFKDYFAKKQMDFKFKRE